MPIFQRESKSVTKKHTDKITAESPFTVALKNDIEKIYPLVEEAHLELIQSAEKDLTIDPDGIYPTSTVNGNVRDKIGKIFVENIVVSAAQFTYERQHALRKDLIELFLKIMGVEQPTPYKPELEKSVFHKMLIEGGKDCNFNSLVERFVTTLIQTLITSPFATSERLNKVKETLDELASLAIYYNMPRKKDEKDNFHLNSIEDGSINFFTKILAHEGMKLKLKLTLLKMKISCVKYLKKIKNKFAKVLHSQWIYCRSENGQNF